MMTTMFVCYLSVLLDQGAASRFSAVVKQQSKSRFPDFNIASWN